MSFPELHSLRPEGKDGRTEYYSPAGRFAAHYPTGAWRPLCTVAGAEAGAAPRMLLASATRIALGTLTPPEDIQPRLLEVQMPSAPLSAYCAPDSSRATVMTAEGACLLDGTAETMLTPARTAEFPFLRLVGISAGVLSTDVGPRALRGDYAAGRALVSADRAAVVGDLAAAYSRLRDMAAEADVMLQPALVAYRLLDSRGNVLFSSAPVLLMAPSGPQCTEAVPVTSPDRCRLDPYTLSAESWSVAVDIPADAAGYARWADVVAVEILASPQFHPDLGASDASVTISGQGSASHFMLVTLPGRYAALGDGWRPRSRSNVIAAVGRFESQCCRIAFFRAPEAGMSFTSGATPGHSDGGGRIEPDFAELFPPHRFSAASVCSDGDTVLWSGITRRRFEGYPLEAFAPLRASPDAPAGAWHASVRVEFDDGESLVRMSEGIGAPPLGVGPLLSYPSPHARRMTLALSAGGRSYRRVVDLVPDASGRRAVYVDPSIRPFTPTLTTAPFDPGTARNTPRRHPDLLIAASAANPLGVGAVFRAGVGRIHAIAAAPGTNQAWEFGSRRFYVGGDGGLASLTLRPGGRAAFKLLDPRPLSRSDAIASADDAVYALLGAPAAVPDLVRIDSGRVRTLMSSPLPQAVALGWSSVRRELTLFADASEQAVSVALDYGLSCFTRVLPGAFSSSFSVAGAPGFALCGDSLCRLSDEIAPRASEVEFSCGCVSPRGCYYPRFFRAMFSGSSCQGGIEVTYPGGAVMFSTGFSGRLPRGVSLPWPGARPTERLTVTFHAAVSPDFRFYRFEF